MKSLVNCVSTENLLYTLLAKLSKPENRKKVVVWVEGKDWRVYRKFFDSEKIIEYGKCGGEQILDGHRKLKAKVPSQMSIVIKDADFNRLEGYDMQSDPDIFYTDGHDVEMMMIKQKTVQNGICEGFEYEGDRDHFFDEVFHDLYFLSYFKWYDCHYNRCYAYAPINNVRKIAQPNLLDIDWIENKVHACSESTWNDSNHSTPFVSIKPDDVREFIAEHQPVDKYEITNGHDFFNRLCYQIEEKTKYVRNEETLNDTAIAHFNDVQFKKTKLHTSLRAWCDNNIDILRKAI